MVHDGTPESHVWEVVVTSAASGEIVMYNKVTGELRKCRTLPLNSKSLDLHYYVTYSDKTVK